MWLISYWHIESIMVIINTTTQRTLNCHWRSHPKSLLKPRVTILPAFSSLTLYFMNNSMSDERLREPEFSLNTNNTPIIIQHIYNFMLLVKSVYRQPSHFKGSFKCYLSLRCLITGVDSSTGVSFSSVQWNYLTEDTNLPVSLSWLYALYSVTTFWQSSGQEKVCWKISHSSFS